MKKSELRNLIRGIIREQRGRDDLEKNKLRPIKPEIPRPPAGESTPNSHEMIMGEVCAFGQYWSGTSFTPAGYGNTPQGNWGGFQCNGQMCGQGDLGQPFIMPGYSYANGIVQMVFTLTGYKNPVYETNLSQIEYSNCNHVFGCTDPSANNYDATATMDDGSCTYPVDPCDTFNSWPQSTAIPNVNPFAGPHAPGIAAGAPFDGHGGNITTGLLEFILQHGATIAGGTPVDSQWILGGTSTYYPSQANYCEWCNYDSTGTAQYWTTSDTSPIGTTNWLMDEGPEACSCC